MKIGASITGAKLATMGAVASGLGLGATLIIVGASIDITPVATSADPAPASAPSDQPRHQAIQAGVGALIESSKALINIVDASSSSALPVSIVLWMRDEIDPSVVNISEVLVLSHRPVLRAITATTFELDDADESPPASVEALLAADPVASLRRSAAASTNVIATDVRAVAVEQASSSGNQAQISLTLTWSDDSADANLQSVVVARTQRWRAR